MTCNLEPASRAPARPSSLSRSKARLRQWLAATWRQVVIRRRINVKGLRILEIGALDSPTFSPRRHNVRFADYGTKETLLLDNAHDPRYDAETLLDVDYAVPGLDYSRQISDRFDLIVANHVVEHIPDTIRWLQELRAILAEGGHVFLSVPDRRHTFDYLRKESTAEDLLRAYDLKLTRPDQTQIFDFIYHFRDIRARDIRRKKPLGPGRYTETEARAEAERLATSAHYPSIHCFVYTYDSFLAVFEDLRARGLIPFEIAGSSDVPWRANEFHVLLRAA